MNVLQISADMMKERRRIYAMLATYGLEPPERAAEAPAEIISLSTEDVLGLNEQLTGSRAVRDIKLLDSAVKAPFQTFGGVDLYGSIFEKAAQLCFGLLKNHPFEDGNKRTATHAMLIFLKINGLELLISDAKLFKLIMFLTEGRLSVATFAVLLEMISREEPMI